jgi:hypothetical protein
MKGWSACTPAHKSSIMELDPSTLANVILDISTNYDIRHSCFFYSAAVKFTQSKTVD